MAPVIFEAAKRISALCSGVGDWRTRWLGAGINTRAPHKRVGRQKSQSIICWGTGWNIFSRNRLRSPGRRPVTHRRKDRYGTAPTRHTAPQGLDWFQDRIKELRRVPASAIHGHPQNFRRHGPDQRAGMKALLSQLGFINALPVREISPGQYELIDGHMRAEIVQGAQAVPVLVVDVTEEEAALALATFDPIGDLALMEQETSDALAREVWSEHDAINTVLLGLLERDYGDEAARAEKGAAPHLELAPLPYEHYDYVVILARTTFDYEKLCALFGLVRMDYSVPKGATKIGQGRVIDAEKAIALLEGRDADAR